MSGYFQRLVNRSRIPNEIVPNLRQAEPFTQVLDPLEMVEAIPIEADPPPLMTPHQPDAITTINPVPTDFERQFDPVTIEESEATFDETPSPEITAPQPRLVQMDDRNISHPIVPDGVDILPRMEDNVERESLPEPEVLEVETIVHETLIEREVFQEESIIEPELSLPTNDEPVSEHKSVDLATLMQALYPDSETEEVEVPHAVEPDLPLVSEPTPNVSAIDDAPQLTIGEILVEIVPEHPLPTPNPAMRSTRPIRTFGSRRNVPSKRRYGLHQL